MFSGRNFIIGLYCKHLHPLSACGWWAKICLWQMGKQDCLVCQCTILIWFIETSFGSQCHCGYFFPQCRNIKKCWLAEVDTGNDLYISHMGRACHSVLGFLPVLLHQRKTHMDTDTDCKSFLPLLLQINAVMWALLHMRSALDYCTCFG